MRVLMTGMSARSVGSTRIRYDFVALSDLMQRALEEAGHEVDRCVVPVTVTPRELMVYDRALVLVNWVSSLSSMHAHEAALALANLRIAGVPTALYFDDWRTESLGDDLDHHVQRPHGWTHHVTKFRPREYATMTADQEGRARNALLDIIDQERGCPWPIVSPHHWWGEPQRHFEVSKVRIHARVLAIDPSPMVEMPDVPVSDPARRTRQWVLATLQNQDRWVKKLGNQWPVYQMGGVKKSGGGLNANTKAVYPERDVVAAYGRNWGMLVAPYRNEGSGWWRPRYTYALAAGAVVHVGSEIDAALIGTSFTNSLREVELATTGELYALQARQREQFLRKQTTREEFVAQMDNVLRLI